MRNFVFTLILTASFGPSALAGDLSPWSCASQVVNQPHQKNPLSDPRLIVSFGAGTREEYDAQMEVAKSLIGKRIGHFWVYGPGGGFEPITVKSVSDTYVFGEKGYDRRGVTLEFSYGSRGGFSSSTSLWDLLLFRNHIEDWTPPKVLRDSPQINIRAGIVSGLSPSSQTELLHEGLVPSLGEKSHFDALSRAGHWTPALNADIHIAQFFSMKTGALFTDNKLLMNQRGEPVILIAREESAQEIEKNVIMLLEYWARLTISKDSESGENGNLNSTRLMSYFRRDSLFNDGTLLLGLAKETELSAAQLNIPLGEYLDRSLKKHGGKLVLTSLTGFPRVEPAGSNKFKILISPQSTMADLLMAWAQFIQKNQN